MPQYEYRCEDCRKTFTKVLTLHEYEEGEVFCPYCDSKHVEQLVTPFYAVTSKKSA